MIAWKICYILARNMLTVFFLRQILILETNLLIFSVFYIS